MGSVLCEVTDCLPASLPRVFLFLFCRWGDRGPERSNGWSGKKWWSENSDLESVFLYTIKPGRSWEQVLLPNVSDRMCGCWWLMVIPGSLDSPVGMRTQVDYGIGDLVSGMR